MSHYNNDQQRYSNGPDLLSLHNNYHLKGSHTQQHSMSRYYSQSESPDQPMGVHPGSASGSVSKEHSPIQGYAMNNGGGMLGVQGDGYGHGQHGLQRDHSHDSRAPSATPLPPAPRLSQPPQQQQRPPLPKRPKTLKACAGCRRARTRCEASALAPEGDVTCHRCFNLRLGCSLVDDHPIPPNGNARAGPSRRTSQTKPHPPIPNHHPYNYSRDPSHDPYTLHNSATSTSQYQSYSQPPPPSISPASRSESNKPIIKPDFDIARAYLTPVTFMNEISGREDFDGMDPVQEGILGADEFSYRYFDFKKLVSPYLPFPEYLSLSTTMPSDFFLRTVICHVVYTSPCPDIPSLPYPLLIKLQLLLKSHLMALLTKAPSLDRILGLLILSYFPVIRDTKGTGDFNEEERWDSLDPSHLAGTARRMGLMMSLDAVAKRFEGFGEEVSREYMQEMKAKYRLWLCVVQRDQILQLSHFASLVEFTVPSISGIHQLSNSPASDCLDAHIIAENEVLQMVYPLVDKIRSLTLLGCPPTNQDFEELSNLVTRRAAEVESWVDKLRLQRHVPSKHWLIIQAHLAQFGLNVTVSRLVQQQPTPLEPTARRNTQEKNGQVFVRCSRKILDMLSDSSWLAEGGITLSQVSPTVYPVLGICAAMVFKMRIYVISTYGYTAAPWANNTNEVANNMVSLLCEIPGWARRCGKLLEALRDAWEMELPTPEAVMTTQLPPPPPPPELTNNNSNTIASGTEGGYEVSDMWNDFLFGGLGSLEGVGWIDFANMASAASGVFSAGPGGGGVAGGHPDDQTGN